MSEDYWQWPIELKLNASPTEFRILGIIHLCALISIFSSSILWVLKLILLMLVLLSGFWQIYFRAKLKSSSAIVRVLGHSAEQWTLTLGDERQLKAQLLPGSVASPYGVWLTFKISNWRHRHVWLLPDSATDEEFRRLRILLNHGGAAATKVS